MGVWERARNAGRQDRLRGSPESLGVAISLLTSELSVCVLVRSKGAPAPGVGDRQSPQAIRKPVGLLRGTVPE